MAKHKRMEVSLARVFIVLAIVSITGVLVAWLLQQSSEVSLSLVEPGAYRSPRVGRWQGQLLATELASTAVLKCFAGEGQPVMLKPGRYAFSIEDAMSQDAWTVAPATLILAPHTFQRFLLTPPKDWRRNRVSVPDPEFIGAR